MGYLGQGLDGQGARRPGALVTAHLALVNSLFLPAEFVGVASDDSKSRAFILRYLGGQVGMRQGLWRERVVLSSPSPIHGPMALLPALPRASREAALLCHVLDPLGVVWAQEPRLS